MKSVQFVFLLLCFTLGWSELRAPQDDPIRTEDRVRTNLEDTGLDDVRTFLDKGGIRSSVPLDFPVIWDELWGLKELVLSLKAAEVEQRLARWSVETRLRDQEMEAEQQRQRLDQLEDALVHQREELKAAAARMEADRKLLMELDPSLRRRVEEQNEARAAEVSTLQSRLNSSEQSWEEQKKKSTAVASELPFLQIRLRANENTVDQLRRKSAALAVRLCNMESEMEELVKQTSEFLTSNRSSELESGDDLWLRDLNSNTQVVHHRLTDLEQKLNASSQSEELGNMQDQLLVISSRLNSTQCHLEELKRSAVDQSDRLRSAETLVDVLRTETSVHSGHISSLESRLTENYNNTAAAEIRLRICEDQLDDLKTEHTVLQVSLKSSEMKLEQVESQTAEVVSMLGTAASELQSRLNLTERLLSCVEGDLKVAFSAGLTDSGSIGPFDDETTLIFSKTMSNVGQAYNQTTGVFTAPIRGLYFFSFSVTDYLKGYTGVFLHRNEQPVIFNLGLNDHGGYASMSNGVVLTLEEGDMIRLRLPASYRLYDDSRNFSVFSGFLLFPV